MRILGPRSSSDLELATIVKAVPIGHAWRAPMKYVVCVDGSRAPVMRMVRRSRLVLVKEHAPLAELAAAA